MPIGLLLVERARTVVGDDEIEVAVEIEIAEAGADPAEVSGPARGGDAHLAGHVGEPPAVV